MTLTDHTDLRDCTFENKSLFHIPAEKLNNKKTNKYLSNYSSKMTCSCTKYLFVCEINAMYLKYIYTVCLCTYLYCRIHTYCNTYRAEDLLFRVERKGTKVASKYLNPLMRLSHEIFGPSCNTSTFPVITWFPFCIISLTEVYIYIQLSQCMNTMRSDIPRFRILFVKS